VEKVKLLLAEGKKVMVSLAPSFVSEFAAWKHEELIAALKKLGFSGVSETALGADFLSARMARDFTKNPAAGKQKLWISSACPSIVEYIKLYAPHLAPCVTPYGSPLLTHARFLRSFYGGETTKGMAVVFIGPCIAKKREADLYGADIDAAITFQELNEWLHKEQITPQSVSASKDHVFEPRRSAKGAFFPIGGGEITAFSAYLSKTLTDAGGKRIETVSVSGIQAVKETLADFDPASLRTPLFLELLACSGGCINGPGMTNTEPGLIRHIRLRDYARSADNTLDALTLQAAPLADADYRAPGLPGAAYTENEITGALRMVGKFTLADRLNCASCGYESCRDFAIALLEGRAEKAMCASYMRRLASKTANGLISATPNGILIVDKNLAIVECNEQFARIMGSVTEELFLLIPGLEGAELQKITPFAPFFKTVISPGGPDNIQTDVRDGKKIYHLRVFTIEKGETAGGIVEDITEPRVRIDKTVERAQEIIKKNVSVVQQIAFLLGENAAESEAILNSIIESYTLGEEEQGA
jgi:hypothetical protein